MASEEQAPVRSRFRSYFTSCDREHLFRLWNEFQRHIGFTHLPSITRRKFEIACRTSYTSLLCMSLLYIAKPYFGPSGFLAPIVSAVTASSLFFGAWAGDLWKVTYSVPLCSIAGVIAGFVSWENPVLQLLLLFVGMTLINRVSLWERLSKVVGGVSYLLGLMWPTVLNYRISPYAAMQQLMMIMVVPWLITGLCLLFPFPSLAAHAAQRKVGSVCKKLNAALTATNAAFCATDYADLYTTHATHLLTNCETTLAELRSLGGFVEYETIFFPTLVHLPAALDVFVDVGGRVTTEMMVLIEVLQQIRNNHTHKTFVEQLRPSLDDMTDAVRDLLRETRGHVCAFKACPEFLRGWLTLLKKHLLPGTNAPVKHHHHHRHHHRHHHHRHAPRYDPIMPTRLSNVDLDVEMMAMINNNDDDSGSDSDSNSDSNSDSEAEDDDGEVGEIGNRNIDDVMVSLDGDDNRSDIVREGKGEGESEDESGGIDLEKAAAILLTNAPTASTVDATAVGPKITFDISHADADDNSDVNKNHDDEHGPLPRLQRARTGLLEGYRRTRELFVFPKSPPPTPQMSLKQGINSDSQRSSARGNARTSTRAGFFRESGVDSLIRQESMAAAVQEENSHLRWRNLLPRSVYLHRVSLLIDGFIALGAVPQARALAPFSVRACVWRALSTLFNYLSSALTDLVQGLGTGLTLAMALCRRTPRQSTDPATVDTAIGTPHPPFAPPATSSSYPSSASKTSTTTTALMAYAQPMKIALAITTTALFIVIPQLKYDQMQNGLWATVCIAFIRQDNTSSSFLTGYQRLEGTVLGSVYAFVMFSLLTCATTASSTDQGCPASTTIPVLILWTFVCAFFREGERRGYAALVAGFTPIVLFLGPVTGTVEGAWLREEAMFLGVGIYLLVDNCIFPFRTNRAVRQGFLLCTDRALEVVVETRRALLALARHAEPPTIPAIGPSASLDSSVAPRSNSYMFDFEACADALASCDASLTLLLALVGQQSTSLRSVVHEPIILSPPFPVVEHAALLDQFRQVLNTGRALSSAIRSLSTVLQLMVKDHHNSLNNKYDRNSPHGIPSAAGGFTIPSTSSSDHTNNSSTDIDHTSNPGPRACLHLHTFEFMTEPALAAASRAHLALGVASTALGRLYDPSLSSTSNPHTATTHGNTQDHTHAHGSNAVNNNKNNNTTSASIHATTPPPSPSHHRHRSHHSHHHSSSSTQVTDLTSIVTLARHCEDAYASFDAHFTSVYSLHEHLADLDPHFLVAFQDVIGSMFALVQHVGELGVRIHTVRNVETIANM